VIPGQQPIRVIIEQRKRGGCATVIGAMLLLGLAIKYWYVALSLLLLALAIGAIVGHRRRQKELERERHRPGPRDPWLNEIAVALGELGFTEVARNTSAQLGGAPLEGDIALQEERTLIYVNLFESPELARQAEIGLRAQTTVREAIANGRTVLQRLGPVLLVAHGGRVVDEYRVNEVARAVARVPLPPTWSSPAATPLVASAHSAAGLADGARSGGADPLGQISKLAELRDAGLLTDAEFDAKKAELLRRL